MKSSAWVGLLKYAVAVVLLAFVVSMNWTALNELFRRTPHLAPLALAAGISVCCTAIQFVRWYLLVRALDLPFTLAAAVRLGLVGLFYNTFLPGSVGGDIVKAVYIARGHSERKAAAVATVVADRLVGLFGLILFSAAVGGACWALGDERIGANKLLQRIVIGCSTVAGLMVVGYLALGVVSRAGADRVADRLYNLRLRKVGHTLAELWYTVWQYRQRPGTVLAVVAMSAVVHTGFVVMFHLATRVFPPEHPDLLGTLPEHFVVIPLGYIVQAVIPLPGGLGGGELTFGGLYKLIRGDVAVGLGLKPQDAVAVGLAGRLTLRLIEWTIGLVGYVAFLRMRGELPVAEAEAAAEEDDFGDPHLNGEAKTVG